MIGNAVPVRMAKFVAESIAHALLGEGKND